MKKLLIGIIAIVTLACGGDTKTSPDPTVPGKGGISFSPMTSASSKQSTTQADMVQAVTAEATTPAVFNFGDIRSTQTYLFQLKNTGAVNVNNVLVTSDNPEVTIVTPGAIAVIPTEGAGGMTPLISVQVIHGVGVNGYGSSALLTSGAFSFNLSASGTDDNGTTISTGCKIDLNVLVAKFSISAEGNPIEIGPTKEEFYFDNSTVVPINGWYTAVYNPTVTALDTSTLTKVWKIKNEGNCPLKIINEFPVANASDVPSFYSIPVGETVDMVISDPEEWFGTFNGNGYYAVESNNTVYDMKFPTDQSGNYCFRFSYYESYTAPQ
jgi:hypothetical protein